MFNKISVSYAIIIISIQLNMDKENHHKNLFFNISFNLLHKIWILKQSWNGSNLIYVSGLKSIMGGGGFLAFNVDYRLLRLLNLISKHKNILSRV